MDVSSTIAGGDGEVKFWNHEVREEILTGQMDNSELAGNAEKPITPRQNCHREKAIVLVRLPPLHFLSHISGGELGLLVVSRTTCWEELGKE